MPPRADQQRLNQLFPPVTDDPPKGTFEIGLILGGTVSAGAYTAGALDFLLEALETWHGQAAPPHKVVIKTVGGSSGGAVCSAILGLLSSRVVQHIHADPGPGDHPNPLWNLWVEQFQMTKLLSTSDLMRRQDADAGSGAQQQEVQYVAALLNCDMIDESGQQLAAMGATPGQQLPYFAAPFRVAITVANLRGIPYQVLDIPQYASYTGAAYVQHDDFAWFAFPNGTSPAEKREDEFWLSPQGEPNTVGYDTLTGFATASGAMPLGLAARTLSRPSEHYWYRPIVRAVADPPGYTVDWPAPDWSGLPDAFNGTYSFTAVDGGTFNNDPVRLVHRNLAGLIGHNPRGAVDAKRALFMIDPLADQPKPINPVGRSFLSVAETIVGSFISESRYLTADMELFANEDVYSRFQLVPFRPEQGRVGEAALSGTGLMAAGGWCARAFRVHDFMLGRSNMKDYLQLEMLLSASNGLFDGWSADAMRDCACDVNGQRIAADPADRSNFYLPIVPLTPDLAQLAPVPAWPVGAFDPDTLTPALKGRLHAVLAQLVSDNGGGGIVPWAVGLIAVPQIVDFLADELIQGFTKSVSDAGLWPPAEAGNASPGLS